MSNLFKNLKKNIIKNITPFELLLKINAFIETFLNNNIDFESEFESEFKSEPDCSSDLNADNNEYESNINMNNSKLLTMPIQQTFDEKLSNLGTFIYSPIGKSNSNLNNDLINDINSNNSNNSNNSINSINNNNSNNSINDVNSNDIENINSTTSTIINSNLDNKIFNDDLLINNLIILSHIEKYQKLSINYNNTTSKLNFQIQIDDSYFPQLSRWYYNQNRTNTISTIDNLIDYTLQQYMYYNSTNNDFYIKKYNFLLNATKKGLLNLKITYELDIENSLKITKIIEKITNL